MGIAFKWCWCVNNCASNVVNALTTRHLASFPCPVTQLPSNSYVYRPTTYNDLRHLFLLDFADDDWTRRKPQRLVQSIRDSLALDQPQPHRIVAHIKTEVSPLRPKKARLIQAFDRYADNYIVADHYRAFTHAFVLWTAEPRDFMGMHVHVRSACGLNRVDIAQQISDWLLIYPPGPNTKIFIDDVSNMDGSVQMPHLMRQAELYQHLSPALHEHFSATTAFKGVVRESQMDRANGPVRYIGLATVKSGAQDTSSGQTCRRLDGIVVCFQRLGAKAIVGFVFGDDVWLLVVGPPSLSDIVLEQQKYGWKTKGVYVHTLEQSEFLSCGFAYTSDGLVHMFPLLGKLFAKLFWTWRTVSPRRAASYRHQVAEGILPAFSGFRFVVGWLSWHLSKRRFNKHTRWTPDARAKLPATAPPGCVCWANYVQNRYGLLMPEPIDWSDFSHSQSHLVYNPWVNMVMGFDLADPAERGTDTFLGPLLLQSLSS